jgi:tetratricopeptide (TPR) repeat protein
MFKWRGDRKPKAQPISEEGDEATRALDQLHDAIGLLQSGQPQSALPVFEAVSQILERLVDKESRRDLTGELASAYTNQASAAHQLGDPKTALATYEKAIAIYERLLLQEGQMQWSRTLAMTYTNKGHAATQLGNHNSAASLYHKAVMHYERLVEQEGRKDLSALLARAYLSTIRSHRLDGNRQAADPMMDRAVTLAERLISQGGHDDLAPEVTVLYVDQALSLARRGDSLAGVKLYDRALALRERLLQRTGDPDLASAYLAKTVFLNLAEDAKPAIALFERAITLYDRLIHQKGRRELAPNLAAAYVDQAVVTGKNGDIVGARALFDKALALYQRTIDEDGRGDLAPDLERAQRLKSEFPAPPPPTPTKPKAKPALAGSGDADAFGSTEIIVVKATKPPEDRAAILYNKLVESQEKAIDTYERLIRHESKHELAPLLGQAYLAKADRLLGEGHKHTALPLYEQGIALLERCVNEEGQREWLLTLAAGYRNKARALAPQAGLPFVDQAIALLTPPVQDATDPEPWPDLGRTYYAKALVLAGLGAGKTARQLQAQAIEVFTRLMEVEGRYDMRPDLEIVKQFPDIHGTKEPGPTYDKELDGDGTPGEDVERATPRAEDLAVSSLKEAIAVRQSGNPGAALPLFDDAISRLEELVQRYNRRDLVPDLERARKSRAVALSQIESSKAP